MDIKTVRENARNKMKGFCALCNECNGNWCAGKVPGMGGAGSGDSFKRAISELKKYKLIMSTVHDITEVNLSTTLFGEKLSMPIIGAPITGANINMSSEYTEKEYVDSVVSGTVAAGTICMIGDTGVATAYPTGIEAIKSVGGKGIAIIKPRENGEIIKRMVMAEEAGAIAVGIDIDGAGLVTMKLFGQPVGPKTLRDLKVLVNATKLPFIVKGIMSVEDAINCVEAGVSAIVVSNHGGRVLNEALAPVEVLEEIVEAVGDKITVLVDGGVREGVDVLKYLALGAKGVLLGRPLIWGALGGDKEGVETILNTIKGQLSTAMILTKNGDVKNINRKSIKKV